MKSAVRDQIEGTVKKTKGTAKQRWAKATGNPAKAGEGAADRLAGSFQKKTGEIKRDVMRE